LKQDNRMIAVLFRKQSGKCYYCKGEMVLMGRDEKYQRGKSYNIATKDHVIPVCRGGGRGDNIVAACKLCNSKKGDMSHDTYMHIAHLDRAAPPFC